MFQITYVAFKYILLIQEPLNTNIIIAWIFFMYTFVNVKQACERLYRVIIKKKYIPIGAFKFL